MLARIAMMSALLTAVVACGSADEGAAGADAAEETAFAADGAPMDNASGAVAACVPDPRMAVADRPSPYDSAMVTLAGAELKVCYGRPSMRGREIFGGLVPYDTIWRTGANEPTILHVPVAATIAGMHVEPGSYSLYTVPGEAQWTVIVNRSTEQWGIESQYTDEIRSQEVGRAQVPAESTSTAQEMFTITAESTGANSANLVLEWEESRVTIPIEAH